MAEQMGSASPFCRKKGGGQNSSNNSSGRAAEFFPSHFDSLIFFDDELFGC
jgi:hypothetical protein